MPLIAQLLLDSERRPAKSFCVLQAAAQARKTNVAKLAGHACLPGSQEIGKVHNLSQQGFWQDLGNLNETL
jgi:hypothetical protein